MRAGRLGIEAVCTIEHRSGESAAATNATDVQCVATAYWPWQHVGHVDSVADIAIARSELRDNTDREWSLVPPRHGVVRSYSCGLVAAVDSSPTYLVAARTQAVSLRCIVEQAPSRPDLRIACYLPVAADASTTRSPAQPSRGAYCRTHNQSLHGTSSHAKAVTDAH